MTITVVSKYKTSTGEQHKITGYGNTRGEAQANARRKLINLTGDPNIILISSKELSVKLK